MTTTDLPGLAQLTHELATAARAGNVMVRVDSHWDGNAAASRDDHGMATIEIGADLVSTPAQDGVVAHEIAHLALGHGHARLPRFLDLASSGCVGASIATALTAIVEPIGDRMLWALLAIAALLLRQVCVLAEAWLSRRQEYEADAYAVQLLDATGRPGLASMRATLQMVEAEEASWWRLTSWLTAGHPPAVRRLQRLTPDPVAAPVEA